MLFVFYWLGKVGGIMGIIGGCRGCFLGDYYGFYFEIYLYWVDLGGKWLVDWLVGIVVEIYS